MDATRPQVRGIFVAAAFVLVSAAPASAQAPSAPPAAARTTPRVEFGLSGLAGAPVSFGIAVADLQRPDGAGLALFETESRQGLELGGVLHVGAPVSRRIGLELAAGVSRSRFETTIRDDIENIPDLTVGESLIRFTVEGGVVWTVAGSERVSWFVRGTGGWLRELIGTRVLGENGAVATVGVGVKYWGPRRPPGRSRYGFRLEGHLATRWNGTALDAREIHLAPVVTAGLIIGS